MNNDNKFVIRKISGLWYVGYPKGHRSSVFWGDMKKYGVLKGRWCAPFVAFESAIDARS